MKYTTLTLLLFASAALAPADTVFSVVPPPGTIYAGQSFTLDVTATTDAMYAFQGDFSFTPGLLQVDNIVGVGDFAGSFSSDPIDNTNGLVTNFLASWVGPGGSSGADIPVAQISLTALTPGDVTVSFAPSLVVTNPDTFDIDPNISANAASFTILETPEPAPFFTVLFTGLCLLSLKRKMPALHPDRFR